ncbi:hypothetical protein B296_00056748 [Ensete ventricosum]|uniref:Uncharacterized protein n=1 Tax=Ensete ventricosum TaxID=4639 RepID=A0A426WZT5_ENSVE|nr:hypothetical protein B296_00056748 [Ensete ventricosum]
MGRVTYEYGYRVALVCFRTLHRDSEMEEDPFTIHPEDDLVPMKRQQAFDDSDPPEGFYSNGYGAPVPEVLAASVTYYAVILRRCFHGPRSEVRASCH